MKKASPPPSKNIRIKLELFYLKLVRQLGHRLAGCIWSREGGVDGGGHKNAGNCCKK